MFLLLHECKTDRKNKEFPFHNCLLCLHQIDLLTRLNRKQLRNKAYQRYKTKKGIRFSCELFLSQPLHFFTFSLSPFLSFFSVCIFNCFTLSHHGSMYIYQPSEQSDKKNLQAIMKKSTHNIYVNASLFPLIILSYRFHCFFFQFLCCSTASCLLVSSRARPLKQNLKSSFEQTKTILNLPRVYG